MSLEIAIFTTLVQSQLGNTSESDSLFYSNSGEEYPWQAQEWFNDYGLGSNVVIRA